MDSRTAEDAASREPEAELFIGEAIAFSVRALMAFWAFLVPNVSPRIERAESLYSHTILVADRSTAYIGKYIRFVILLRFRVME